MLQSFHVERGLEFFNRDVTGWLKENNIIRYSTYSEHKSVVVERFNRTLKEMMRKRFTAENARNWIDILDTLLRKYNNKFHTIIGLTPASLKENEMKALQNIIDKTRKNSI